MAYPGLPPGLVAAGAASAQRRTENLALIFQEILTVVARLRANSQAVGSPQAFRNQITLTLRAAVNDAVRRQYAAQDAEMAALAVVALLDESVLNSRNPAFGDWVSKPLGEELFGVHLAGENYFRNLDGLLARPDSQDLADVLEIYQLGLLLGFRGKHSKDGQGGVRGYRDAIAEKIRRIRGGLPTNLSYPVAPPRAPAADPWQKRLLWTAGVAWIVALAAFLAYKVSISSAVGDLRAIVGGVRL